MGFKDYDLIWNDLEAVMKKYGYQIVALVNAGETPETCDDVLRASFIKGDEESL